MKIRLIFTMAIMVTLLININPLNGISENKNITIYVDDDGGADFTNIQDAIDNSNQGDTIFV